MNAKVKKFLKWFIIILLVVGSVAATVFIFFKNYNERLVKEVDLLNVIESEEKDKFDTGFSSLQETLINNGQATWFEDVKSASNNLDESLNVLSYYYIENGNKVKDKEISSTYSSMMTTRSVLIDMFDEYNKKASSVWFPKLVGANDIYVVYSNYLVKYAKLVNLVNNNLSKRENFDTTSDIKFSMIDLYSRIVIDTFSKVIVKNDLQIIQSDVNIDEISKYFNFNYSYIVGDTTSLNALRFIQNYNDCNKELFADKFFETLGLATGYDENSTKEIKAAFYFNEVF